MAAPQLPDRNLRWPLAWAAVVLLANAESLRLRAYKCPAGVWTIGWGETEGVKRGDVWTKAQADQRLCDELSQYARKVRAVCTIVPDENELGAFVSLAYNIGLAAFARCSVLRLHNRGDHAAAARAFALFNTAKVDGKRVELPGLTARRAAEAALYLQATEDDDGPADPMPQAVAPETSLAASPIARSGAITAGGGVLSLLSAANESASGVSDAVSKVSDGIGTLRGLAAVVGQVVHGVTGAVGVSPAVLLGVALLATGLVAVYWRWKQRQGGFA